MNRYLIAGALFGSLVAVGLDRSFPHTAIDGVVKVQGYRIPLPLQPSVSLIRISPDGDFQGTPRESHSCAFKHGGVDTAHVGIKDVWGRQVIDSVRYNENAPPNVHGHENGFRHPSVKTPFKVYHACVDALVKAGYSLPEYPFNNSLR